MRYGSRLMGMGMAGLLALGAAACARGQVVAQQVFSNNALLQPEIDVVNSGVVTDIQATVSADRKYVTLNMRAQNSQLINLFVFNFQSAGAGGGTTTVQLPSGFVGGVNPVVSGLAGAVPSRPNAPMVVGPGNGGVILLKRGITPLVMR